MSNKNLIIVESPSKIKTLKKFLGDDYHIEASVGHFRDLPTKNLGIDLENNFKPEYVVSADSKKVVKNLKSVLKKMDAIYIATDPDREGEAIAWHLIDELKPQVPVRRMVFNEITKNAILDSLQNIRDIDLNLVNAQECRRFLDRLFGFLVSKELWFNVKGGLSAGRVQSPAVKILVDREKQRSQFVKSEYWSLQGNFKSNNGKIFSRLVSINNEKIAIGKSFNRETGKLSASNTVVLDEDKAQDILTIDLVGKTSIADRMIVASGASGRMVTAMTQHIIKKLKDMGIKPKSEGEGHSDWVLIDAGDVIVHLFRPEVRAFYNIERIWAAPTTVSNDTARHA